MHISGGVMIFGFLYLMCNDQISVTSILVTLSMSCFLWEYTQNPLLGSGVLLSCQSVCLVNMKPWLGPAVAHKTWLRGSSLQSQYWEVRTDGSEIQRHPWLQKILS